MFNFPFIKNPKTGAGDSMLTMAILSMLVVLGKVLLNGVTITIMAKTINFGTIDAGLAAAVITPILTAYVARKHTDKITNKPKGETNV